jgi:hypothetical protein
MAGRAAAIRARLLYAVRRGGPATFTASAPAGACHRCERLVEADRDYRVVWRSERLVKVRRLADAGVPKEQSRRL